jgi:hypothetical protein
MPLNAMDISQNGNGSRSTLEGFGSIFEIEDILRSLDRPRTINVERNRSFEVSNGLSPRQFFRDAENQAHLEHLEYVYSPSRRSILDSPRGSSYFESQPVVADAWEALRRSLVYFRGQPVGTIAAVDNSVEKVNYDQVSPDSQFLFPFNY